MSRGRIIGLISGKGGVGKTSVCVNMAVALKQFGNDVTVVDADFSASNLNVHLGRYDHPVKIQQVLRGEAEPSSAMFRHPTGIQAIVSSNEIDEVEPNPAELGEVVEHAAEESDYVLVDCPPGLDSTVENIMMACDELMIVTMPTQTSTLNAAQIIEKAKDLQIPVLGTVINMSEDDPETELIDREIEMMTESHIMAGIPHDQEVKRSLFNSTPLLVHEPLSDAALEIKELAARIDGKEFEKPSFPKLRRGFKKFKENISS